MHQERSCKKVICILFSKPHVFSCCWDAWVWTQSLEGTWLLQISAPITQKRVLLLFQLLVLFPPFSEATNEESLPKPLLPGLSSPTVLTHHAFLVSFKRHKTAFDHFLRLSGQLCCIIWSIHQAGMILFNFFIKISLGWIFWEGCSSFS